jgi:hypothetical protein
MARERRDTVTLRGTSQSSYFVGPRFALLDAKEQVRRNFLPPRALELAPRRSTASTL